MELSTNTVQDSPLIFILVSYSSFRGIMRSNLLKGIPQSPINDYDFGNQIFLRLP